MCAPITVTTGGAVSGCQGVCQVIASDFRFGRYFRHPSLELQEFNKPALGLRENKQLAHLLPPFLCIDGLQSSTISSGVLQFIIGNQL